MALHARTVTAHEFFEKRVRFTCFRTYVPYSGVEYWTGLAKEFKNEFAMIGTIG